MPAFASRGRSHPNTGSHCNHANTNTRRMAVPYGAVGVSSSVRGTANTRKETLIARFGGDVLIPDVRHLITQCPRKDAPGAACGVYSADLRD
jgi:hypothetical protein